MTQNRALGRAFLFGAVSGLRSMLGAALISRHLSKDRPWSGGRPPLALLSNSGVANVLSVLSAGEIVADKLPWIPARTQPVPLLGRAALGALAGAAACAEERENVAAGALIGGAAAVALTFGAYYLRRWLTRDVGIPDPVVAGAEDTLAYTIGQRAVSL